MIKIKESSLHFRWYSNLQEVFSDFDSHPKTLCKYFWNFIFINLLTFTAIGACVIGIIIALSPLSLFFVDRHNVFFTPGVAMGIFYTVILIVGLYNKFKNNINFKDTLIYQFLKAKKDKVCPLVEYE